MKKFLLLIFMTSIILLFSGCSKEKNIVIYSSMEEERNQALTKMLKEKFPDRNVDVQYLSTGNNAAKIKSEGTNTKGDIVLGLEVSHMEDLKDMFYNLSSIDTSNYIDGINPTHLQYLIWEKYTASIIIDENYFEKNHLKEPRTYDDLLNSEYKGKISMPDPKTSGTGYMYYLNVKNIKGETEALKYFDNLSNNINQFTTSGSGPINLLKQGEIAIAMGMTYQGVEEINNGANYKILELDTGTPFNYTGVAIMNGHENKSGVKDVFNWLINDFMKYDRENFVPGKIIKNQKNNIKNYPSNLKDANMDGIEDSQIKNDLLNKWKY